MSTVSMHHLRASKALLRSTTLLGLGTPILFIACAVGEPLDEETISAAALQDGLVAVEGDDDGPAATPSGFSTDSPAGSGGSGSGPAPDPGNPSPGTSNLPPGSVGQVPIASGAGGAGSVPTGGGPGPEVTGTRLVPIIPTVPIAPPSATETATAPTGTGGAGPIGMGGAANLGGTGGVGGAMLPPSNVPTPEQIAASDVVIHYRPTAVVSPGRISATMYVENRNAAQPLPLDQLTVRYWYTSDGFPFSPALYHNYYNGTPVGPRDSVTAAAGTDGDEEYLELTFTQGTDISSPSNNDLSPFEFQIAVDQFAYDQENDWSFDASLMGTPNLHVTAYLAGTLVWGEEPDGDTPGADDAMGAGGDAP